MLSSKRLAQLGLGAAAAVFAVSFAALLSGSADLPVSTVPTTMNQVLSRPTPAALARPMPNRR